VSGSFTPERIAGLVEGAATVARQVDLSDLLRLTVEIAMDLTGARYGALGVVGEHGGLVDFVTVGMDTATVEAIGAPPRGRGVLGTITTTAKTIRLEELTSHADAVGFPEHHPEMSSFLGVPVRVGERVFGNLYLTDKPGAFTEDDEILVEFLAITAGSAVSTLELQERLRRAALLEDRERIARDLHDSIIQDLFAVGLSLQSASNRVTSHPAEVAERIEQAVEQLDETIGALRRFIFDLRPPMWARPSLRRELADLVGQLSAPYDARVSLDVNCPPDLVQPDLADELLQIVKEALSNALRHSTAATIAVRVGCGRSQVVLSVSDDGRGFDPGKRTSGMGLANMAERVRDAGGSIRVDSEPGTGTTVRVSIPIA
jgi:signal transduction histidine kinase